MDVIIKELETKTVLAIRHVGPYPEIGAVFQTLSAWAGKNGLFGPETEVIGVYYDNPETTPAEACRSDACITLSGPVEAPEGFHTGEIAGGAYAMAVHAGPYEKLPDVYMMLYGDWPRESGRQPDMTKPCFESYLNNPYEEKPEDLRTEVYMPLLG